jgi:hypothetical protein
MAKYHSRLEVELKLFSFLILKGRFLSDGKEPFLHIPDFVQGFRLKHFFRKGSQIVRNLVVFYISAEHHVAWCKYHVVYCTNIKKSAKMELRWSKECSAENPSESNPGLKRTRTIAIFKKIIFKMRFKLRINFQVESYKLQIYLIKPINLLGLSFWWKVSQSGICKHAANTMFSSFLTLFADFSFKRGTVDQQELHKWMKMQIPFLFFLSFFLNFNPEQM